METFDNLDINLEMSKIALAGMNGAESLRSAIESLVTHYEIECQAPTPADISRDMMQLIVDVQSNVCTQQAMEERLESILTLALEAQDPLVLNPSQGEQPAS